MFNNSRLVTDVQVISFPAQYSQTKALRMGTQMCQLRRRSRRNIKQAFSELDI